MKKEEKSPEERDIQTRRGKSAAEEGGGSTKRRCGNSGKEVEELVAKHFKASPSQFRVTLPKSESLRGCVILLQRDFIGTPASR